MWLARSPSADERVIPPLGIGRKLGFGMGDEGLGPHAGHVGQEQVRIKCRGHDAGRAQGREPPGTDLASSGHARSINSLRVQRISSG